MLITAARLYLESIITHAMENQKTFVWWNIKDLESSVYQQLVKELIEAGYGISNTGTNPVRISFYC